MPVLAAAGSPVGVPRVLRRVTLRFVRGLLPFASVVALLRVAPSGCVSGGCAPSGEGVGGAEGGDVTPSVLVAAVLVARFSL